MSEQQRIEVGELADRILETQPVLLSIPPEEPTLSDQTNGYVCDQPGCNKSYRLPQHLGLHRWYTHGIPSDRRLAASNRPGADHTVAPRRLGKEKKEATVKKTDAKKTLPKIKPAKAPAAKPLTAIEICFTVLMEVSSGRVPVETVAAYGEWVTATQRFLDTIQSS